MTTAKRANVVSSFNIIKGAMISVTYEVLSRWDFAKTKKENLDRLREENYIAAPSSSWLRDVAHVLNRRLDPNDRDRPLALLAQGGCPLDEWRPLLLWHITRDEFLVRDFLINWLFVEYDDGVLRVRNEDLDDYLSSLGDRGGEIRHPWTHSTRHRVASGLIKMSADFHLLRSTRTKEFVGSNLPDRSFVYLLYAILAQEGGSPQRLMDSTEWRMYLMRAWDVQAELLRMHQYQLLDFQFAGSLVQLSLPCDDLLGYAQEMVA